METARKEEERGQTVTIRRYALKNHRWTDEEREIIRLGYDYKIESVLSLAKKLGVSRHAIAGQLCKMGLRRSGNRAPWSSEEDERLAHLLSRYAPSQVAHKMHRSINSVCIRAKRLHISRRNKEGWFSKQDAMNILGVSHHWVQHYIDNGELKASYHYPGHKPGMKGMAMWHIESTELKHFIKHHSLELQGRPVDIVGLIEVLAW